MLTCLAKLWKMWLPIRSKATVTTVGVPAHIFQRVFWISKMICLPFDLVPVNRNYGLPILYAKIVDNQVLRYLIGEWSHSLLCVEVSFINEGKLAPKIEHRRGQVELEIGWIAVELSFPHTGAFGSAEFCNSQHAQYEITAKNQLHVNCSNTLWCTQATKRCKVSLKL